MPGDLRVGIRLTADGKGFVGELRVAGDQLDRVAGRTRAADSATQSFGRSIGIAHQRVAGYVTSFLGLNRAFALFRVGIANTVRQEQALAQVEARIRSTGGAAGVTADEVAAIAASLQRVTTTGDEEILEMQGILLSFRRIAGATFGEATEAVLDLATATGTDLRSAAIQLGKALDDPATGLDGLSRAGTKFTEAQQDLIRELAESGRLMEAQALILAELQSQYGGAARAARDTLGGALAALANTFGDLLEAERDFTGPFRDRIERLDDALQAIDVRELHEDIRSIGKLGLALLAAAAARAGIALAAYSVQATRAQLQSVRLAAATTTATGRFAALTRTLRIGRTALAVLTGPAGLLVLAGYAAYELATSSSTAAESIGDIENALDDTGESIDQLISKYRLLAQAQLDVAIQGREAARDQALTQAQAAATRTAAAEQSLREAEEDLRERQAAVAREESLAEQRLGSPSMLALRERDERIAADLVAERSEARVRAAAAEAAALQRLSRAEIDLEATRLAAASSRRPSAATPGGTDPADPVAGHDAARDAEANARALLAARRQTAAALARLTLTEHEQSLERERLFIEDLEQLRGQAGIDEAVLDAEITARKRLGAIERGRIAGEAARAALAAAEEERRAREEAAEADLQAARAAEEARVHELAEIRRRAREQELLEAQGYRDREAAEEDAHQRRLIAIRYRGAERVGEVASILVGHERKAGVDRAKTYLDAAQKIGAIQGVQSRKLFRLQQAAGIAQVAIATARGVAEALATSPVPNYITAGFIAAAGAVQIAAIRAQRPPQAFARGGIVDSPTFFSARNVPRGVAGEAGPEAILPLARGPDGRLGVEARTAAAPSLRVTIAPTIHVTVTADPDRRPDETGAVVARRVRDELIPVIRATLADELRPGGLLRPTDRAA